MSLIKERLAKVTDEEMDLVFRIARLALEMDNGSGHYERMLEVSEGDIDSLFVVLEETIDDRPTTEAYGT